MTIGINISLVNSDTDSDSAMYSGSDTESESESEPDYSNNGRFNLVLCELHHPDIHGFTLESDPTVIGYHMVITKLDPADKYDQHVMINLHNQKYDELELYTSSSPHPIIRNYDEIIQTPKYIQPHIAECIYIQGNECVAIIKTIWIRIIFFLFS